MTTLSDLIFVALFAAVAPIVDYSLFWPAHRRLAEADPKFARRWLWASAIANLWTLTAFGAALWLAFGRPWSSLGFTVPDGWRLWTAIGFIAFVTSYYSVAAVSVARDAAARAALRKQFGPVAVILPRTNSDLVWFGGVSLTAGFCEEFLYRGWFIWTFAPWLGWWGAAALSLPFFAVAHLYQGWSGVLRTGIAGAVLTLVVAAFDSLWPAIALHAIMDLGAGVLAWLVLRDGAGDSTMTPPVASSVPAAEGV